MPVKNGSRYLTDSLPVIFSNASLDDEVIIINDGSTDNTLEILNLSKKDFPNLRRSLQLSFSKCFEVC